jgi:hypothetical protein
MKRDVRTEPGENAGVQEARWRGYAARREANGVMADMRKTQRTMIAEDARPMSQ